VLTPALRALPLPLALVLTLAACSGAEPVPDDATQAAETSAAVEGTRGDAVGAVVVEGEIEGTSVEVGLGPVARDGDLAVLPVAVTATGGETEVYLPVQFGFTWTGTGPARPTNLRLVDTERRTVALTAHDAEGVRAVENEEKFARPGEGTVVFHAVFAAPSGDSTAVLVPHLGLVEDVPVVDEAEVGVAEVAAMIDATPDDLTAPVRPLDVYREVDEGTVRTREVEERTTVSIATDVLFASSSAELSPEADAALEAAGRDLVGAAPGGLTVVGHTDDVGSEQLNQDLSERRADAVARRLGELVDLSSFHVTVEGRAFHDPAVDGTSAEARALNRRVELEFATSDDDSAPRQAEPSSDDPPAATGPVGTAREGVVVDYREGDGEVRVDVERVRRVGRMLVGDLRVERVSGEPAVASWAVNQGTRDARGTWNPQLQTAATGVTLLVGDERIFPLDYALDDGEDADRHPLAELDMRAVVDVGGSDTVTVVWPDVGADTVTVDLPPIRSAGERTSAGAEWRITDVPVQE
jgi:outer membrane protein OmpA-like peptidoglycan-associated protein